MKIKLNPKYIFFLLIFIITIFFIAREFYLRLPYKSPANNKNLSTKEMVNNLDDMMTNYYRTKDTLLIPSILQNLSNLNIMEFGKHKYAVMGFLTGAIKENESKALVPEWKKLDISKKTKNTLNIAIKYSDKAENFLKTAEYLKDVKSVEFYTGYFSSIYDMRCIRQDVRPEVRETASRNLKMLKLKYKI